MQTPVLMIPRPGRRRLAAALASALVALVALSGCTSPAKQSDTASYLTVLSLTAASGADTAGTFTPTLASDVLTFGTTYADPAMATFQLSFKDPSTAPTPVNFITIQHYRVRYISSTSGPVPEPFEGAMTFTVTNSVTSSGPFTLVRAQAKSVAPLAPLAGQGGTQALPVTAEVTFEGTDQNGRAVSVTGAIGINFGDWADPGVTATTPQASFTITPASGLRAGQTAEFNGAASVVPVGRTIALYSWTFGDGASAAGIGPQTMHAYGGAGQYTVRLTITDSVGQTYATEKTITVQ